MPPSSFVFATNEMDSNQSRVEDHRNTEFFNRCREKVEYIINKKLEKTQRYDKIGEKLFECCTNMRQKYEPFFNGLPAKLCLTSDNLYDSCIDIMDEVLSDNECNFGRIVSIHTFCLVLAEFCNESDELKDHIGLICDATADTMCRFRKWFEANNAWYGLFDFFTTPGEKLWKGVVITTFSLSAIAGMIYAHS